MNLNMEPSVGYVDQAPAKKRTYSSLEDSSGSPHKLFHPTQDPMVEWEIPGENNWSYLLPDNYTATPNVVSHHMQSLLRAVPQMNAMHNVQSIQKPVPQMDSTHNHASHYVQSLQKTVPQMNATHNVASHYAQYEKSLQTPVAQMDSTHNVASHVQSLQKTVPQMNATHNVPSHYVQSLQRTVPQMDSTSNNPSQQIQYFQRTAPQMDSTPNNASQYLQSLQKTAPQVEYYSQPQQFPPPWFSQPKQDLSRPNAGGTNLQTSFGFEYQNFMFQNSKASQAENCGYVHNYGSIHNYPSGFGLELLKTPPKQIVKPISNPPKLDRSHVESKHENYNFQPEKSVSQLGKTFRENFNQVPLQNSTEIQPVSNKFLEIEKSLSSELLNLDYSATCITHISNPIEHAWDPHQNFIHKFMNGPKSVLFLGMNPGPWGMSQTGVPFGQVQLCKDWLKVTGDVVKPSNEHPKRPIQGFNCKRDEVSGRRFWSFFQNLCGTPEKFFADCMVYNHCPLAFMKESGKNVTPPEIKIEVRKSIVNLCDKSLADIIGLLGVKMIIGIGKFSEARAKAVVKIHGLVGVEVKFLMHPSPLNPLANKGWNQIAEKTLMDIGIYEKLGQNASLISSR